MVSCSSGVHELQKKDVQKTLKFSVRAMIAQKLKKLLKMCNNESYSQQKIAFNGGSPIHVAFIVWFV